MTMQLSLDVAENLDARVCEVLAGKNVPWQLSADECALLRMLQFQRGAAQALPAQTISLQLGMPERRVKMIVKSLIEDFGIPIGGSRQEPVGYFLIVTPDDLEQALRPLRREVVSIGRRMRALTSDQQLGEIFNQVRLELGPACECFAPVDIDGVCAKCNRKVRPRSEA